MAWGVGVGTAALTSAPALNLTAAISSSSSSDLRSGWLTRTGEEPTNACDEAFFNLL